MDALKLLKPSKDGVLVITKNTPSECSFVEIKSPALAGRFVNLTDDEKDVWLGRACVLFNAVKDEFSNKSLSPEGIYSFFTLEHIEHIGITRYLRTAEAEFNAAYERITDTDSEDEKHNKIMSTLIYSSTFNRDCRNYLQSLPAYGLVSGSTIDTEIKNCINRMVDRLEKINITSYDYDFIERRLGLYFPYVESNKTALEKHSFIEMLLVKKFKDAFKIKKTFAEMLSFS
jgi:hypothetical protein